MSDVFSAEQFRSRRQEREQGELVELESGITVRLHQPQVSKMIADGVIPGFLINASLNVQMGQATDKDLENNTKLKRTMVKHTVMEPQVVDNEPGDNQITLDDLTDQEIDEIYYYANGGMENLRKFRSGRQGGSPRPNSEEVSGDAPE